MPSRINKHGLSHDIPDPVKREVRRACGFGCVICGCMVGYQYAHFNPPWPDAEKHDPDQIALLCGRHHRPFDSGEYASAKLAEKRRSPRCRQGDHPHRDFIYSGEELVVCLGESTFVYPRSILRIHGREILVAEPSDEASGPVQLTGAFYDRDGNLLFEIRRNEWFGSADAWDIEVEGPTTTIRRAPGEIALKLAVREGREFCVERLDMYYEGVRIYADRDGVRLGSPGERAVQFRGLIRGGECCIDITAAGDSAPGALWATAAGGLVISFGCGASLVRGDLAFSET